MRKRYATSLGLIKSHPDAKLPTQSMDDVGFDVYSVEDVSIENGNVGKVNTGLQYATRPYFPESLHMVASSGTYAYDDRWSFETKVEGRSGLASKFIFPIGGIIDPSYRGDFVIILANHSGETFNVKKGDKIAQLVLRPVLANTENHHVEFVFRESQDTTERGTKGFGSSGV